MYSVKDLYEKYKEILSLTVLGGREFFSRPIRFSEVNRPGLSLSGYLKQYTNQRILLLGNREISYLRDLEAPVREERIRGIITPKTPALILGGRHSLIEEIFEVCEEEHLPLLRTKMETMEFAHRLTSVLREEFSPQASCHGTLVEVFGIGLLIEGDSSVGKSEAALGLIERGHRLVTDDVVEMRLRDGTHLEGSGPELTRHLMEIRGIGIINVAHLYGAVCVRDAKKIDMIVRIEEWDDAKFYDRIGLDEQFCDILNQKIPYHILPVKPGRDVVLLLETIVLNYRLKQMGFNSAKEFNIKLLETIQKKQRIKGNVSESLS